jgi:glycosyltransferase involved in cell wall biosynthesis
MTLPQFVYVGGADVRKRIDVLLHAFASFLSKHPQFSLVLIGSNYGSYLPSSTRSG